MMDEWTTAEGVWTTSRGVWTSTQEVVEEAGGERACGSQRTRSAGMLKFEGVGEKMSELRYKIGKFIIVSLHKMLIKLRLIS